MNTNSLLIMQKLAENFQKFSEKTAFHIKGISYTYKQFQQRISAIQKIILSETTDDEVYIGVLSHDHLDTYASVFALWFSGKAFVPLNPLNPSLRNEGIIGRMGIKHILSAGETSGLDTVSARIVINTVSSKDEDSQIISRQASPETDVYVLFTSGSTGTPKGVRINRRNLDAFYHSYISFGPEYNENDRFLQIYDISFDGSVPCYLVALCAGAAVYTVPQDEIKYLYALKLMKEHELSVVKMAPSTLYYFRPFIDRISLPSVRCCIFGGEALPLELTEEWMKCIPGALIQNAYGPTEATIDSLMYNFNAIDSLKKSSGGVISLGKEFGDFEYAVVNSDGIIVEEGETGELCLCGDQVMTGYWKDDDKTDKAFVHLQTPTGTKKYYRTGDLVFRDADGYFMFCGRIDNQVQIQGYRIELGEIEKQAKHETGEINLAAVEIKNDTGKSEIALFIEGDKDLEDRILSGLQSGLPHYMLPSRIIFLKELPRLPNGKTDRKKLSEKTEFYENN